MWLRENHNSCNGIWMIFYKKHKNTDSISYKEALEEALCYGWIDSIIKKIDNDSYVRKFTPRTNTSNWSQINRKLFEELVRNGRMTEAGLKKYGVTENRRDDHQEVRKLKSKNIRELIVPDFILNELAQNEPALKNFNDLALSYKRNYILWITTAKKEETILKRLKESVALLKENRKLGLK